MEKILVAGATGYLGHFIVKQLLREQYHTTVVVRNPDKFNQFSLSVDNVIKAECTDPDSLASCCKDIDVVISSLGITKQKDGLSYMDVDYQANLNLLNEAKKSGVKKFIYVSVLNGDKLKALKICQAKERFVAELQCSGLDYCIIRPNGFFSDMTEFYNMALQGRIYLFGDGHLKSNPIHGADLAKLCVEAINSDKHEISVGGPEILTQLEIAQIAFEVANKPLKILFIPDILRRITLSLAKLFLSRQKYGPVEFFMNVMAMEMVAPVYGKHKLKNYFSNI